MYVFVHVCMYVLMLYISLFWDFIRTILSYALFIFPKISRVCLYVCVMCDAVHHLVIIIRR